MGRKDRSSSIGRRKRECLHWDSLRERRPSRNPLSPKCHFMAFFHFPSVAAKNIIVVYLWGNGWFVSQSGTEPLLHWEGGRWIATDGSVWKKIGSGRKGRWTDRWEERGLCKATTLCGPLPPPLWLGYFPLFLLHAGGGASDKVPGGLKR